MKTIESMLKKECFKLKKIISICEKRIGNAPKGNLRIAKKKNRFDYYLVNEGENKRGRYLRKKENGLAREVAQRDYDIMILQRAKERLKGIEKFLVNYEKTNLGSVFNKLNVYRKELVNEVILSDEEFVKQWQMKEYVKKEFEDNAPEIVTEKGEYVR